VICPYLDESFPTGVSGLSVAFVTSVSGLAVTSVISLESCVAETSPLQQQAKRTRNPRWLPAKRTAKRCLERRVSEY
jgi:hypothetical protein